MNKNNFDFQQALLPEVKKILACHLIAEAPPHEDMRRNTDLIVLKMDAIRIAVRLRRNEYLYRTTRDGIAYADQFTIRSELPKSGGETELGKVLSGWGDYNFYGFANANGDGLAAWFLGDLYVFRRWFSRQLFKSDRGFMPGDAQTNCDGKSNFRAFNIAELPPEFVVARVTADMGDISQQAVSMSLSQECAPDSRWTPEERKVWGL